MLTKEDEDYIKQFYEEEEKDSESEDHVVNWNEESEHEDTDIGNDENIFLTVLDQTALEETL